MFHVAPYLNASPSDPQQVRHSHRAVAPALDPDRLASLQLGRKRHIGNDVVVIVFYEGNSPLKLDFGGFIRT